MSNEQPIFLDPDDDLKKVTERLAATTTQRVVMIVPPQTELRSNVFWRLLYARTRGMGKEVTVFSADRQTRSVAKSAGFRVADAQPSTSVGKDRPSRFVRSPFESRQLRRARSQSERLSPINPENRDIPPDDAIDIPPFLHRSSTNPENRETQPHDPTLTVLQPNPQTIQVKPERVGQQFGNYHLIRLLGRGGFADVYLGQHLRLKTLAAIKILHTHLPNKDIEGFQKEAETIANLRHPHIVRILDFDVEDDVPFLVMDYATHGTVRERFPKGTRLPMTIVVSYVKQVAEALLYAHDQKLIHRDIKPENMLLGPNDAILLSDFGIAVVTQSSRSVNLQDHAGTVYYMAPEQIQGKPRRASDQYALGVVAFEWLSGTRPFSGTYFEVVNQHLTTEPPPLQENNPDISPAVEQVIKIALAKDPDRRFASIQAFANALEQASKQ